MYACILVWSGQLLLHQVGSMKVKGSSMKVKEAENFKEAEKKLYHYNDVTMSAMASQITGVSIVYSFRCRSKKTSKLCVTGLCEGNSSVTDEFPAQRAITAENVSIWWRHHVIRSFYRDAHGVFVMADWSGPFAARWICVVPGHSCSAWHSTVWFEWR